MLSFLLTGYASILAIEAGIIIETKQRTVRKDILPPEKINLKIIITQYYPKIKEFILREISDKGS